MKALLQNASISTLLTAGWLSVTGIAVTATEPSGCKVRVLLKAADGKWKKWSGSAWADAPTQALTVDSVLAEGNTKEELGSATALDWLKNTSVHFAVALEDHGVTAPKLENITLNGTTGESATQKVIQVEGVGQPHDAQVGGLSRMQKYLRKVDRQELQDLIWFH